MRQSELLYAIAAASANLLGAVAVTSRARWTMGAFDLMLSFAAGVLIAVSIVDLLPESIEQIGTMGPVIALGAYVLVHVTQHTIGKHFHFGEETHAVTKLVSLSALVGLLMHTFVDGVAVASGVAVSEGLGLLVFIGVFLHKFPEGLAISSLFLAAGLGPHRALLAAAALGVSTIAGMFLTDHLEFLRMYGMPIAAGVTLYVGASNLVPEIQQRPGLRLPTAFVAGCLLYLAARALLHV